MSWTTPHLVFQKTCVLVEVSLLFGGRDFFSFRDSASDTMHSCLWQLVWIIMQPCFSTGESPASFEMNGSGFILCKLMYICYYLLYLLITVCLHVDNSVYISSYFSKVNIFLRFMKFENSDADSARWIHTTLQLLHSGKPDLSMNIRVIYFRSWKCKWLLA